MRDRVKKVILRLVFAGAFVFIGGVAGLMIVQNFRGVQAENRKSVVPEDVARLLQELGNLQQTIADADEAGDEGSRSILEKSSRDRLLELERQIESMTTVSGYLDTLMEANSRLTTQGLSLASLLITSVGAGFTVFVVALGFIGFSRFEEVKTELADRKIDLDNLETSIRERVADELKKLGQFGEQIEAQQQEALRTREFVQTVSEQFFSVALMELLAVLQEGGALEPEADRRLRNKVREVQDRIRLHDPDSTVVEAAIRDLSAIGSPPAIPDLMRLLGDVRLKGIEPLILSAVRSIDTRHAETRG